MNYIYSLVDETVRCAMNIKTHKCKKGQCESCAVWQRIQSCSADLNDWEKLEVQRLSRIILSNRIEDDRSYNSSRRIMKFFIVLLVIVGTLAFGKACELGAEPYPYMHYDYYVNDGEIRMVLRNVHKNVHDCDLDGKVNCCDYAMQFKKEWDKLFSPCDCEIVRNYWKKPRAKKPVMNHLFVRVRLTPAGKWLYVEPQAEFNSPRYGIEDYWGNKYNSRYNQYGETTYWMNTWRR